MGWLRKPLSALRSKRGFVGAGILVCYGIYGLIALLGQLDTIQDNAGPVLKFLGTGPGVLLAVLVAVVLIVWAANTQQAETGSATPVPAEPKPEESAAIPSSPIDREDAAGQEATIELGDTARLFLTDGSRFVPDDDSERRTIFLPALLEHWAGALSTAVKAGRTFVATGTEFDRCDIYGPGVFLLAEGSVEDTFHKCDWEEEWRAFQPATKPALYVGVIALKNCKFRRCNFKGVGFVVKPDEYRRMYRRFTGDDL